MLNNWLQVILNADYLRYSEQALVTLVVLSLLLAIWALLAAARAKRRMNQLAESLTALEQSMQSAANIFAETDLRMNAACAQIGQLAKRQGTLDAAAGQAGFKQAIALSRRGASVSEIVDTCGVSHGEARLICTMYATGGTASH
ncbi:MAG: DUF2802 domain-containing protein [Gammaproteobacteria bacterium]|nr:DUF2802 domain-containing protein [Gammaproteobacteria bacterium]NND55241.1 DUF2802 domain-containing protein [Gammaproteobacteria bacterium]